MKRFVDNMTSRTGRFSLGRDQLTGSAYLSIPVANRLVDYEEYYALDEERFQFFLSSEPDASAFAEECRQHKQDNRLILAPGTDRGTAI